MPLLLRLIVFARATPAPLRLVALAICRMTWVRVVRATTIEELLLRWVGIRGLFHSASLLVWRVCRAR
jgi:hypothetical protein